MKVEPILDRIRDSGPKGQKEWSAIEVEALLLKLREEIMECLK